MADRTIKPDDTNDLVLSNNDGSSKLELNEDQTVKVTTGSDADEDFTVNTTQLVVEGDTGNVGIGDDAPPTNLQIKGSGGVNLGIESTGSAQNLDIDFYDSVGNPDGRIRWNEGNSTWYIQDNVTSGSKDLFTIAVDGNGLPAVGINASPSRMLHVNAGTGYGVGSAVVDIQKSATSADAINNYYMIFRSDTTADGYLLNDASGNLVLSSASDERLKENIRDADYGLNEVMQLRPVTFDWKDTDNQNCKGFIAQEVQPILPKSITELPDSEDDQLGISTTEFIPLLTKAIQELSAKVTALENA
jgi:hypothetical protein